MTSSKENAPTIKPAPGDYYFENGLMVFTAAYHLKRGTCCGSGCRHCPYGGITGSTQPVPAAQRKSSPES